VSCSPRAICGGAPRARLYLAAAAAWALGPVAARADDLTPPRVLERADAEYPAQELADRREATVELLVTLGPDGLVMEVEEAAPAPESFARASREALRRWRFAPAERGGQSISSRIRIPFRFVLPLPAAPDAGRPEPLAPGPLSMEPSASAPPGTAGRLGLDAPDAGRPEPLAPGSAPRGPSALAPSMDAGLPDSGALDAGPASHGGAPQVLEATVVGRQRARSRGTADFEVDVGALAAVPRANAAEMLKLAPGILLTNEGGEAHAEQIFLRGFDAREGQDVEISVGGIPVNESGNLHGNGYADLHFVIPEVVASLRVVEGPFDPSQGNYAVAGSVEYELGLAERGLTAKASAGSFGTRRLFLAYGAPRDLPASFGAAELFRTDGFGQNRDAMRGAAMAQMEGRLSGWCYRLLLQGYAARYHSAGVLREDDFKSGRAGFFDTYDFNQGGDSARFSGGLELSSQQGAFSQRHRAFLVRRSMGLRENFTGFLEDPQEPLQPPHGQRGDLLDVDVDEWTFGARGAARYKARLVEQPQEIEVGYFARGDVTSGLQQRIEAATLVPYRTDLDLSANLADLGLYLDASLKPARWMTVRGGVRADLFTFDVMDRCAAKSVAHPSKSDPPGDQSCLDQQDYGRHREANQRVQTSATALMPRAVLLLGPWRNLTVSGSWGRGMRSIDPQYVTNDVETPFATAESWEMGLAWAAPGHPLAVAARTSVFRTHVDRDLIFSETTGRNAIGGGTTRLGWLASARAASRFFDLSTSATLVRSRFDDTGLLIPYVPDLVVRSEAALFGAVGRLLGRALSGRAGLGLTYVGRRALPLGQRSDAIFTLEASASLAFGHFSLELAAQNLLDRQYRLGEYHYASDFHSRGWPTLVPARHFTAGAPRSLTLSLAVSLGEAS
jgi:iron complex outermembrane receptor protein